MLSDLLDLSRADHLGTSWCRWFCMQQGAYSAFDNPIADGLAIRLSLQAIGFIGWC